ncbi:Oidioi.mRNA.OKI2018_I69.XSR.g16912.t1.cds [Oikopleura dioica]|uniref:Oidioi.mRNA.OKI2018_I69.XSR.g16912.t1.cds n=1 Tax=Oikopleura dioica TaxID=34765 RepID=A0ABN7SHL0_OIKDI|nr:Oidioi.mRNA.OKI2018_I69.XSR.g16912.t1.cds [Oikopleura dioica]
MSTESASSWERVPSDYDIVSVSSPSTSLSRADSPNSSCSEEPEIALPLPSSSKKIVMERSKETRPIFSTFEKAPSLDPFSLEWKTRREAAIEELPKLTSEMIEATPFSKMQWRMVFLCFVGGVADGIELMCISFVLPHIRCSFALSAVQNSLLSSVGFIGLLLGGLVWGSIGDAIGRSATLSLCMAVNGIFGLLTAFSTSWFSILLCRFMAGVGIGGSGLLFTYVCEIAPKRRVGLFLSILATSWMLANVLASILAYLILPFELVVGSWRIFITLCTLPAIFSSILFMTAPESPNWLASQGRVTDVISSLTAFFPQKSFKHFKTLQPFEKLASSSPVSVSTFLFENLNLSASFKQLLSPQLIKTTGKQRPSNLN